jgi:hypothetical protein
MRRQMVLSSSSGLFAGIADRVLALGRSTRRGAIRAVAIAAMLVAYAATSIGTIGTSALGVVGISGAALLGTATPAQARRRWRRHRYRRRHRGYYWGGPYRWRRERGVPRLFCANGRYSAATPSP